MKIDFLPFHLIAKHVAAKAPNIYESLRLDYDDMDVDWDYFVQSSLEGSCHSVTATDDGELVGLMVFLTGRNSLHNIQEAESVLIYVDKKYRGRLSFDLISKSNEFLKSIGVEKVNYVIKDERIGQILSRYGFQPEYTTWSLNYG